jgi:ABC-type siderophore export system fused ATPase/permease subunit
MEYCQVLLPDEWAADQVPLFREVFYRKVYLSYNKQVKPLLPLVTTIIISILLIVFIN